MSYRVKIINPEAEHEWDREITFAGSEKEATIKRARNYLRKRGDSVKNYVKSQPRDDIELWTWDLPVRLPERVEDNSDPISFRAVKHAMKAGHHCWQIVSPSGRSIFVHGLFITMTPRVDIREALLSANQQTDAMATGTVRIMNDLYFDFYLPFKDHFLTKEAEAAANW